MLWLIFLLFTISIGIIGPYLGKLYRRGKISFRTVRVISTLLFLILGILAVFLVGWLFAILVTLWECILINYSLGTVKQMYDWEDEKKKMTKPTSEDKKQ